MTDNPPRLFWPSTIGPYTSQIHGLLAALSQTIDYHKQIELVEQQILHLPSYPNAREEQLRYRAYLLVLVDLLNQQWRPDIRQGQLYLLPPDWSGKAKGDEEIQARKEVLRQSLQWERDAQFQRAAVQEFILMMERERQ